MIVDLLAALLSVVSLCLLTTAIELRRARCWHAAAFGRSGLRRIRGDVRASEILFD